LLCEDECAGERQGEGGREDKAVHWWCSLLRLGSPLSDETLRMGNVAVREV
jgi:hypothetical protein